MGKSEEKRGEARRGEARRSQARRFEQPTRPTSATSAPLYASTTLSRDTATVGCGRDHGAADTDPPSADAPSVPSFDEEPLHTLHRATNSAADSSSETSPPAAVSRTRSAPARRKYVASFIRTASTGAFAASAMAATHSGAREI